MASIGKKIASGSTLRTANLIAQVVISFFLMPFIIASLGDRLYGFWTLVGTFIGYYGLMDLGLSNAVNRHMAGALGARDHNEINLIYNTALPIYLAIGLTALLITAFVAGFAPLIIENQEDVSLFRKVILILGVNMAIDLPARVFIGVLYAQLNFVIVSAVQIGALLVRTFLVVLALTAGFKVLALALITFFVTCCSNIVYFYFAKKSLPIIRLDLKCFNRLMAKKLFSYSFFVFISQVAEHLLFYADSFVIASFLSLAAVTHYTIASMLVEYFRQLIGAGLGVLAPLFSQQEGQKNDEALKKTFYFSTKISVIVSSFIGFGLIAWGYSFIERWMGSDYLDSYPCLILLVSGVFMTLCQSPAISLLFATSKHKFFGILSVIEAVVNISLSLLLVKAYGLVGVAIGTFVPMIIVNIIVFPIYFCRVSFIQYSEYMFFLVRILSRACFSLSVPMVISLYWVSPSYPALFVVGTASFIIYIVVSWNIQFNHQEKNFLLDLLPPLDRLRDPFRK